MWTSCVSRVKQLDQELDELENRRDQVVARVRELENEAAAIDGSAKAAEADQRALGILSRIQDQAERYMRIRLAASILRQQIERYRAENQDPLLAKASALFAQMTCSEFKGLKTDFDESGSPVIVGVRRNQELVRVENMSDGTRDPLYLSLRLAYLQRRLDQQEPLPLIVDDILIHLDDERALATLLVLAELSQQTQVLFFTHHQRLRELAEAHLSGETLKVHQLIRRELSAAGAGQARQ